MAVDTIMVLQGHNGGQCVVSAPLQYMPKLEVELEGDCKYGARYQEMHTLYPRQLWGGAVRETVRSNPSPLPSLHLFRAIGTCHQVRRARHGCAPPAPPEHARVRDFV